MSIKAARRVGTGVKKFVRWWNYGDRPRPVSEEQAADYVEAAGKSPPNLKWREQQISSQTNDDAERIRKSLDEKDEQLVENMGKIRVDATPASPAFKSTRQLPSHDSEAANRHSQPWEYGFYEPPEEKIPAGKMSFREAITLLRAKQELDPERRGPAVDPLARAEAERIVEESPARRRVDDATIDKIYTYFRPFERRDVQRVVTRRDLEDLRARLLKLNTVEFEKNWSTMRIEHLYTDEPAAQLPKRKTIRERAAEMKESVAELEDKNAAASNEMHLKAEERLKKLLQMVDQQLEDIKKEEDAEKKGEPSKSDQEKR